MELYHGNIVYARTKDELTEHADSYIGVENGIVEGIWPVLPEKYAGLPVTDFGEDVIIPAFTDLHVHAPQYPQRALHMDILLNEWLNTYVFPLEEKYADPAFAHAVYDAFLDDLVKHGTMHAVIFGTIHRESTGYLVERMEERGLRGYVSKVNMDTDSPAGLCEDTKESLLETERFLDQYRNNRTAKPLLAPRFAPTCSWELLTGLGKLAKKYGVGVQTHLVESLWEATESVRRYPECGSDTAIYEKAGLLGYGPFFGAHFIYPTPDDIRVMKKYNGWAIQCPEATVNVIAGIMSTAALSDEGIKLGIGSDIAGGHTPAIYTQIAKAVQFSKIKAFYEPEMNRAIPFAQAFYMGTKQSGSAFGNVGSLEPGYAFDALVIGGVQDPFQKLSPAQSVERFCCLGESSNIHARYLNGKRIG